MKSSWANPLRKSWPASPKEPFCCSVNGRSQQSHQTLATELGRIQHAEAGLAAALQLGGEVLWLDMTPGLHHQHPPRGLEQGCHLAMAAVLGQTTAQLTRWMVHDAPPGLDQAALLEEVVQLLTRYLQR